MMLESLWIGRLSRQSNVDFALHLPIIELLTGQVDDPESDDGSGFLFLLAEFLSCLLNPLKCHPFPQNFQSFKQPGSILPSADGNADGLEHLSGFDAEFLSGAAEGLI